MKVHHPLGAKLVACRPVVGVMVAVLTLGAVTVGAAYAEPTQDSVADVEELSRNVEQLSQTILNAQPDYDKKLQLLAEADKKYADDLARLTETSTQLATYQRGVDQFAAAAYMGGRTDGISAILTAPSPSDLIENLAANRVLSTEMSQQMKSFRRAQQSARIIEAASAKSAQDAKAAVEEAAAVRADLTSKRAQLRTEMAAVTASYSQLPPVQQAALTLPTEAATAALGPIAPIPTVGMNGLVPNAKMVVDYIMATYPGVKSIGGVRADPLPDHPSGRAVDIMIGSDMALGDAINADLKSQAGRFGISYTMWRVSAHFDHVHVSVG